MIILLAVVIGAIVTYLAYSQFMTSPEEPAEPKKEKVDVKEGKDSEKEKLRERMMAKKVNYFDQIEKEASKADPADGGAKEEKDDIREMLLNPGTTPDEIVAITKAMGEASREDGRTLISKKKLDEVWKKHRGDAKGPADAMIEKALAKSDKDNDGKIQKEEMARITTGFMKHCGAGDLSEDKVFELLDEDQSGDLTFEELRTAFKAMWLMKKNGVKLSELVQDV